MDARKGASLFNTFGVRAEAFPAIYIVQTPSPWSTCSQTPKVDHDRDRIVHNKLKKSIIDYDHWLGFEISWTLNTEDFYKVEKLMLSKNTLKITI